MNAIAGALIVNGQGAGGDVDIMNVSDAGDAAANAGSLTATTLTGLGMGPSGITYSGIEALSVTLGSGSDTFHLLSTGAATTINTVAGADTVNVQTLTHITTINTGTGADTINVSTDAPANAGTLNAIAAPLFINGQGGVGEIDALIASDAGDAAANTGILTPTTLTGLGLSAAGIIYSGLETLRVELGPGADTFLIENTGAVTTINGNDGADWVNVHALAHATTINSGNGSDVINVSTDAPLHEGHVNTIAAPLAVHGGGLPGDYDNLNISDRGDPAASVGPTAGRMTSSKVTGLGMTDGVTYSGIEGLKVLLGSGNDTVFTLQMPTPAEPALPIQIRLDAGVPAPGQDELLLIQGTNSADVLTMGPLAEGRQLDHTNFECLHVFALAGDDRFENYTTTPSYMVGGLGNDSLVGGNANDFLLGDGIALNGTPGRDALIGLAGADLIFGGGDVDTIISGDGADQLFPDYDVFDIHSTSLASIFETVANGDVVNGAAPGDPDPDPDNAISFGTQDVLNNVDNLFINTGAIKDVFTWLGRSIDLTPANVAQLIAEANLVDTCNGYELTVSAVAPGPANTPVADNPLVADAYLTYLGRPADAFGLQSWSAAIADGLSIDGMRAGILGSAEYLAVAGGTNSAFVTRLFDDVLGRAPAAGELQSRLNQLTAGVARSDVALALLRSLEARSFEINSVVFVANPPAVGLETLERNALLADLAQGIAQDVAFANYALTRSGGANYSDAGVGAMATYVRNLYATLLNRPAPVSNGETQRRLGGTGRRPVERRVRSLDPGQQ